VRKRICLGIAAFLALTMVGCGGESRPVFTAQIFSDQPTDGDIAFDGVTYAITAGPDTVFFGFDDNDPNSPEYRAFLDFPLDGSTGQDAVPADAEIVSATLEVFVNRVDFVSTVPSLIDLVTYPIGGLTAADFNSLPLTFPGGAFASRSLDFLLSDQENYVAIGVTSLMQEAQRRGLSDFQVRFLLDSVPNPVGFVGVEDRLNIALTAPLLTVEYR
jgi:hypothetical protein